MQRVTLQVEKLVLTDGTVVLANTFSEPFFVNVYDDYPDTPNQFKLFLDSYKNAAGEQGKVWNASEDTLCRQDVIRLLIICPLTIKLESIVYY